MDSTVRKQYREIVDRARVQLAGLQSPGSAGWLRLVRNSLGMSGTHLAERLGVTRGRVSQMESAELDGAITIKSMQRAAEAMNCRFVYAVVPEKTIRDMIIDQAKKKAISRVRNASTHMALEDQLLSESQRQAEVERITEELIRRLPADLWSDE